MNLIKTNIYIPLFLAFTFCCATSLAQNSSPAEKVADALNQYVKLSKKGKQSEASDQISRAAYIAKDQAYKLGHPLASLVAYVNLLDMRKHRPKSNIWYTASDVCAYGAQPDAPLLSYTLTLATADAKMEMGKRCKPQYKAIYYLTANFLLDSLRTRTPDPDDFSILRPVFKTAGFNVSKETTDRLYKEINDSLVNLTAKEWFMAACLAVDDKDLKKRADIIDTCIAEAEKKGYADASALLGHMFQNGIIVIKSKQKADSLYSKAAEKGGIWGGMQHAKSLIDAGKYKEAYESLLSFETHEEFSREGGNYLLGILAEKGIGHETGTDAAKRFYTANIPVCRWNKWKKDSQIRIDSIAVMTFEDELAAMRKDKGPYDNWKAKDLAIVADTYKRFKKNDKSLEFRKMAAEKGHGKSACIYAVSIYDKDKRDPELFRILSSNEKSQYLPLIYNLAVVYVYGYGIAPDHGKAREYLDLFLELAEDEIIDDYDIKEYIPTVGGKAFSDRDIKSGLRLKSVLDGFESPSMLYNWGHYRQNDAPREVWLYFLKRAAEKGSEKAMERLKKLGEN